jgi:hypothetical protein
VFAGHYGFGMAAKEPDRRVPLWVLFLAVQVLDLIWALLILTGVEHARVVDTDVAGHSLAFTDYPISHSLVAAIGWSALAYLLVRRFAPASWRDPRAAVVVAIAVFSHWPLDLIVHQSDMPLVGSSAKVGLDLWQYSTATFVVEALIVAGGLALYLRATEATTRVGRWAPWVLAALLILAGLSTDFAEATDVDSSAVSGLIAIVVLPALAWVAERGRRSRRRTRAHRLAAQTASA